MIVSDDIDYSFFGRFSKQLSFFFVLYILLRVFNDKRSLRIFLTIGLLTYCCPAGYIMHMFYHFINGQALCHTVPFDFDEPFVICCYDSCIELLGLVVYENVIGLMLLRQPRCFFGIIKDAVPYTDYLGNVLERTTVNEAVYFVFFLYSAGVFRHGLYVVCSAV